MASELIDREKAIAVALENRKPGCRCIECGEADRIAAALRALPEGETGERTCEWKQSKLRSIMDTRCGTKRNAKTTYCSRCGGRVVLYSPDSQKPGSKIMLDGTEIGDSQKGGE